MTNKDDLTKNYSAKNDPTIVAEIPQALNQSNTHTVATGSVDKVDVVSKNKKCVTGSTNERLDSTVTISKNNTDELTKAANVGSSNTDPTLIAQHTAGTAGFYQRGSNQRGSDQRGSNQCDSTRVLTHHSVSERSTQHADGTDPIIFEADQKPSSNRQLIPGTVIKGRFILEECIGYGGMGVVHKARDIRKEEMNDDASYVAIKFLNDALRNQKEALVSLQREAKKSQALAHPNIVTVYDFDRDDDLVFLSMEYLSGKTLDELIATQYCQHLPVEKVMHLIELVARALAYSHQQGFVHADLKPSNVFLTNDGNIKVLDFGIAQAVRLMNGDRAGNGKVYNDSQFDSYTLGAITPNFASPEMLNDQAPSPADDMYSLGCVAYALLAGKHPFLDGKGAKVTATRAQQNRMEVHTISRVSRRHMRAIRRCLEFDGSQRFQNAGEFIDAIKPPIQLRRWVVVSLSVLTLITCLGGWYIVKNSTALVGLNDLPASMSELVQIIESGDISFENDDIDQAHKLYSQAWAASYELDNIAPKDQLKLKVIIDRRINAVIHYLIAESRKNENPEFRLLQLQIALEFLKQGEVGTLDHEVDKALIKIRDKLRLIDID